jgi:hypothetical protein
MQPDTVHRLAVIVEDELAAVVGAVDGHAGAWSTAEVEHPSNVPHVETIRLN